MSSDFVDANIFFNLQHSKTEEEVKFAYATYFGIKVDTTDRHDLYTPQVLFEFKYNKHFDSVKSIAQVLAQILYLCAKTKILPATEK
ncbi:hypothetical protein FACS189419_01430 [Planctomycetales bacterium]|nr:hypothetical protein FACS189419_01430 [Planctomycetales bacterium]